MIISGTGVPLKKNNIDTDQIIPAEFCLSIQRESFSKALFGRWRKEENFILNNESYNDGTILVVGKSFATGSSREYAVWALKDYGFKIIVAENFGEIFYKNSIINKLLPLKVEYKTIKKIWNILENDSKAKLEFNLKRNELKIKGEVYSFSISDEAKNKYMKNEDDITSTLNDIYEIEKFEKKHLSNLLNIKRR